MTNEKKRERNAQAPGRALSAATGIFYQRFPRVSHTSYINIGPLENLINQNKDAALTYSYQLMQKNAKRLMNLISELMNFKKVSDSVVKLRVQPVIINQFCKNLALEFQNLAISKDIDFKMIDSVDANPNLPVTGLV